MRLIIRHLNQRIHGAIFNLWIVINSFDNLSIACVDFHAIVLVCQTVCLYSFRVILKLLCFCLESLILFFCFHDFVGVGFLDFFKLLFLLLIIAYFFDCKGLGRLLSLVLLGTVVLVMLLRFVLVVRILLRGVLFRLALHEVIGTIDLLTIGKEFLAIVSVIESVSHLMHYVLLFFLDGSFLLLYVINLLLCLGNFLFSILFFLHIFDICALLDD